MTSSNASDVTRKPVNAYRRRQFKPTTTTTATCKQPATSDVTPRQRADVITEERTLDEVERSYFEDFQDEADCSSGNESYSDEDFCADDEFDETDFYTETVTATQFEKLAHQPRDAVERGNTFSLPDLRGSSSLVGSSNHSSVSVHSEGAAARPMLSLQERFGATKEELSLPEIASISQGSSNDETSEDSYTEPLTPRSKAVSKKHCSLPDIGLTPRLPPPVTINFITPRGVDVMFTDSEGSAPNTFRGFTDMNAAQVENLPQLSSRALVQNSPRSLQSGKGPLVSVPCNKHSTRSRGQSSRSGVTVAL